MKNPTRFSDLLKRYAAGTASEKEKAGIDAWLEHRAEANPFGRLPEAEQQAMIEEVRQYIQTNADGGGKHRFIHTTWFRAAAAIILLAVASFTVWQWQAVEIVNVTTLAETQKVILPDGSIIWLKENSTLTYPDRFKGETRSIAFSGEALFEIAKDKDRPFIIESGALTATVLGTSFNIKTTQQDIEVTVLTGTVSLAVADDKKLIVTANQKAVYQETAKQLARITPAPDEKAQLVAGTEYNMVFTSATMHDIAQRIAEKFDVRVTLENPAMNNCLVTADFTDHSLRETLHAVGQLLGFAYEINNKQVTLNGEGCN